MTATWGPSFRPMPGQVSPPPYRLSYEGERINRGDENMPGSRPAAPIWGASAYLVECPYCCAPPFTRCHTYGSPSTTAQYTHSGRGWAGHEVIKRALAVENSRDNQCSIADEPAVPERSPEEFADFVRQIVDEHLAKNRAPARRSAAKRTPAKRPTAKRVVKP